MINIRFFLDVLPLGLKLTTVLFRHISPLDLNSHLYLGSFNQNVRAKTNAINGNFIPNIYTAFLEEIEFNMPIEGLVLD